jgi:uracil-DNA glycosylase family 4
MAEKKQGAKAAAARVAVLRPETNGEGKVAEPSRDCPLCPRLVAYREENRRKWPEWFNAPVPSFGPLSARLLVVGLAPGLKGANRTGRPFTGDFAGTLLYETLIKSGFARGTYGASPDDGLELIDCRIVNAVRCAPPKNLPDPSEIIACNTFLRAELQGMPHLEAVLALGHVAHLAVLKAYGLGHGAYRFRHGAVHALPDGLLLVDSYHVSRYNTQTGRLTAAMFEAVVAGLAQRLARAA